MARRATIGRRNTWLRRASLDAEKNPPDRVLTNRATSAGSDPQAGIAL